MTRIDNYLEKYLDGSISEKELAQFRDLLESEPRLRAELSRTLELRSIIHDDLLELTPPTYLSDAVRESVADQFASLALEEEEEKERKIVLSGRFAGSSLVAMVALVLIALAPTWISTGGDSDPLAGLGSAGTALQEKLVAGSLEAVTSSPVASSSSASEVRTAPVVRKEREVRIGKDEAIERVAETSLASSSKESDPEKTLPVQAEVIGETTDNIDVNSLAETRESARNDLPAAVSQENEDGVESESAAIDAFSLDALAQGASSSLKMRMLQQDPSLLLDQTRNNADLFASTTIVNREDNQLHQIEEGAESASRSDRPLHRLRADESEGPRITFGGTLGSGLTTKESTFSIQGSAYLAMALGEGSRIGLEGGSTMFRYRKAVPVQTRVNETPQGFARRANDPEEFVGIGIETRRGGDFKAGGIGGTGGGGSPVGGTGGSLTGEETSAIPDNRTDNAPSTPGQWNSPQVLNGDNPAAQSVGGASEFGYDVHTYESEASMVYGLVFYDHTVTSLNKQLNINGRVGVGGANGGIVLNARAYAAISTHENIAWTLGVGGSILHGLSQDIDFNANYGVNAGVELGF